jgi:hypothetical protein
MFHPGLSVSPLSVLFHFHFISLSYLAPRFASLACEHAPQISSFVPFHFALVFPPPQSHLRRRGGEEHVYPGIFFILFTFQTPKPYWWPRVRTRPTERASHLRRRAACVCLPQDLLCSVRVPSFRTVFALALTPPSYARTTHNGDHLLQVIVSDL